MKIDISEWREFRVGDLFTGQLGKNYKPNPEKGENSIPFVSSTAFNNGRLGYLDEYDEAHIMEGPALSVCSRGNDAITFYWDGKFIGSNNVTILKPISEHWNKYSLLFISSIISSMHSRFNYTNIASMSKVMDLTILLPATPTGEPDFLYMESYMKGVEAAVRDSLTKLLSAIR